MSRGLRLRKRAVLPELMDDFSSGGTELREALRKLRLLNRIFVAAAPTLYGVRRLWEESGKPSSLSILDVGAGSGDVNKRLLKWADQQGVALSITLVDLTEEACEEARWLFQDEPRVQVKQGDLLKLEEESADIITGTQFLHHFTADELPLFVQCMLRASRVGVVVNDIHRHWMSWTAVWVTSRLISTNRYIRHDAPLSVAKGFRAEDWEDLRRRMGHLKPSMHTSWRPLFRYSVVISKKTAKPLDGVD